ncbi:MAG TPA: hypothetical protein VK875_09910 [Euzebyales bacterium]|nr:hypothetical protein [Euzebyales bacterium]
MVTAGDGLGGTVAQDKQRWHARTVATPRAAGSSGGRFSHFSGRAAAQAATAVEDLAGGWTVANTDDGVAELQLSFERAG